MQVSFEADSGRYPGFVGVRGLQVQPGYCHPVPLRATQGTCSHDAVLFFFFCWFFFVFSSTKCQLFNICFMLTNISSLGVVISVFHAVLV